MHSDYGTGGRAPRVVSSRIVALYRESDGMVVHVHTVRVFDGGRPVGREEAESTALAQARSLRHDVDSLRILHAEELPLGFGAFRVDPESGGLVGIDSPPAGGGRLSR